MKILDEKYLTLEYDETLKCIIQTWIGFSGSDNFRNGVEKTNELFQQRSPTTKFLVDGTNAAVIAQEDTDWAAKTAIPIAMNYGLKFYGFVVPKNIFSQLSLQQFKKALNQPSLEIQLFDDLSKAKQWMSEN